jgi:hypothetical protein
MGKVAYMKKAEFGAGERKEIALKEKENSQNNNALNMNITENSASPTSSNTNTLSEQDLKTIAECYDFEGLL